MIINTYIILKYSFFQGASLKTISRDIMQCVL